jgi:hypothetical protein
MNLATHQTHELPTDDQTEARATEPVPSLADLLTRPEDGIKKEGTLEPENVPATISVLQRVPLRGFISSGGDRSDLPATAFHVAGFS